MTQRLKESREGFFARLSLKCFNAFAENECFFDDVE